MSTLFPRPVITPDAQLALLAILENNLTAAATILPHLRPDRLATDDTNRIAACVHTAQRELETLSRKLATTLTIKPKLQD